MWSLVLSTFNAFSSPVLSQGSTSVSSGEIRTNNVHQFHPFLQRFEIAQTSNLIEAISTRGYSLKYSPNWQPFVTESSDQNSDIFIRRSFSNSYGEPIVLINTTIMGFLGVPKELPPNVKRFDRAAAVYTGILAQSGYKINDRKEVMINGRRAVRLMTETPDKKGSITVVVEAEEDRMVVSTSVYPIDSSIMSSELLEQVVAEIGLVQNSITIR